MSNNSLLYLVTMLLFIGRLRLCSGTCHTMISYGYARGDPLIHRWYLTGDIREGYNVWRTEDQSLYLFAYLDIMYHEHLWVIDYRTTGGNWVAYTLLYKDNVLSPYEYAFFNHHDWVYYERFKFTCEDDIYNILEVFMIDGYCEEFIMTEHVKTAKEHHISQCLSHCQGISGCTAFTFTDHSCVPHTRGCVKPALNDPGHGSRHYSWSTVGIEGLDTAYQSSVGWEGEAIRALDKGYGGDFFSQLTCISTLTDTHPWWAVDLKYSHMIQGVAIKVRTDCCSDNLAGVVIGLGVGNLTEQVDTFNSGQFHNLVICTTVTYDFIRTKRWLFFCKDDAEYLADYIVLYQPSDGPTFLSFCEIEVIGHAGTKYTVIGERVTQQDGDAVCSSKLSGKGLLARSKTKEEFDLMAAELKRHNIDIAWTGHKNGDSLYTEFWYPNVTNRRLMNVYTPYYGQCVSTPVTSNMKCDFAFDGNTDPTSSWIFEGPYGAAWLKIELRYAYILHRINLMQTFCKCSSINEIELTYSDLSTQKFQLKERQGLSSSDSAGQEWDVLTLNGVMTKTVLLVILSVHDNYTKQGGIVEMQVIGEDYGADLRSGICQGYDIQTLYGDIVSCYVACRNLDNCQSLVYYYKGSDFTTCVHKSAICSDNEILSNDNAFTLDIKDFDGTYTLRYGQDSRCVLNSFYIDTIHQCSYFADVMVGAVGFSITAQQYDMCVLLCAKDSTGHVTTDTSNYIFFEKIGLTPNNPANVPSTASSYVGCYHEWELSHDQYKSNVKVTDPVSNLPPNCITTCHNQGYLYAALQIRDCMCRVALGQQVDGCSAQCFGDDSLVERCGLSSSKWTVYTTLPQLSTDCIQLSKKMLEAPSNHHPWMADTGTSQMQNNYCDTEYPLICENSQFNFCDQAPCENGGRCEAFSTTYTCHCEQGYTGNHCENDVDECTSADSCSNGAQCVNSAGSFSCVCLQGYTGTTCQTDIDECSSQPCQNNGICEDRENSYSCDCDLGYTGLDCETDINECDSQPCQHGGVCQNYVNRFHCLCKAGYAGVWCERDIDECASQPCLNGGTCSDWLDKYQCSCVLGYDGDICQVDINECSSSPCQNGATCLDLLNQFECKCVTGFDGIHCENDINDCWSGPCENNGPCIDLVDGYTCDCLAGFGGDNCELYIGNPGDWSEWGSWGECSTSCDQGVAYRTRDCVPQFPELGGGICSGSDSDSTICMEVSCGPVDGRWSPWSPTTACSPHCGPGIVAADRVCSAPKPSNGGDKCAGENTTMLLCENRQCLNRQACTKWTEWTVCHRSCELEYRSRERSCRTDEDITEVVEEQVQPCQPDNCHTAGLECSVCSSSESYDSIHSINCGDTQRCTDDAHACSTSFEISEGNLKLTKGCMEKSACQSLSEVDGHCKQLAALGLMNGQSLNGTDVHAVVVIDVLRLWLSLQDICSLCCNTQNCNTELIPHWESLVTS